MFKVIYKTKKGEMMFNFLRKPKTVGDLEKKYKISGAIRNKNGRDTRSDKLLKNQQKQSKK